MDEPTTGLHLEDIRKLAAGVRPARRRGAHARPDRAQPRRHQARRLGHRSRSRSGRCGWRGRRGRDVPRRSPPSRRRTPGSGCGRCFPDWNMPSGIRRAAHGGKPAIATRAAASSSARFVTSPHTDVRRCRRLACPVDSSRFRARFRVCSRPFPSSSVGQSIRLLIGGS